MFQPLLLWHTLHCLSFPGTYYSALFYMKSECPCGIILSWDKVLDDLRFDPKLAAMLEVSECLRHLPTVSFCTICPSTWCILSYCSPALVSEALRYRNGFAHLAFNSAFILCRSVCLGHHRSCLVNQNLGISLT